MHSEQSVNPGTTKLIDKVLTDPLQPGEIGVLLACAGAGKTACLTHIALDRLLQGQPVLHVCIDVLPDKIKLWYQEVLRNLLADKDSENMAMAQHRIEPLRFILAYLNQTFTPGKLGQSVRNLKEQAGFNPSLVIVDGFDFENSEPGFLQELKEFAQKYDLPVWMSARTHRHITRTNERGIPYPCDTNDEFFQSILLLEPGTDAIRIKILKQGSRYEVRYPEVILNPITHLLQTS